MIYEVAWNDWQAAVNIQNDKLASRDLKEGERNLALKMDHQSQLPKHILLGSQNHLVGSFALANLLTYAALLAHAKLGVWIGSREFWGDDKNILKLGCYDGCTTINWLKIIELHTFNGWLLWCVN